VDDLILVTGGAGFIGSHVVNALLDHGAGVRVLDDFSSGKRENLEGVEARAHAAGGLVQVVQGDVRDEDKVRDAVQDCIAVVHLAAVPSVTRSFEDPLGCNSVTHGGTVNVVRRAVEADVARFVLASSCALYGDAARLPIAETAPPQPLSPYAAAKLAAEEVCAAAADSGQIAAVCLRLFNVYGPRQDPSSEYSGVISRFMTAAAAGEGVTIHGDGLQTRDFVYVKDVVDAVLAALGRPVQGVNIVNVGSGTSANLLDCLDVLELLTGAPVQRSFGPGRDGEIRDSLADVGRARWVLGWEAVTGFADGLTATWEWYADHGPGPGRRGQ
jgi:UDP-glucose 4-epimerase